jgi:hypothetical protein
MSLMSSFNEALLSGVASSLNPEIQAERQVSQRLIDDYLSKSQDARTASRAQQIIKIRGAIKELALDPNDPVDVAVYQALKEQLIALSK